nr:phage N-6-adenine-methyltransferase [Acinetobacter baumannii]
MNTMAQRKLFGLAENRTDVWSTPQDFFEKLDRVFNFDLDVCALPENAKCERYFTPEIDGLKQEWTGTCWMNPPYGREIVDWVAKAAYTAEQGHTVVALVPVRTDARWFQDYCLGREITLFVDA